MKKYVYTTVVFFAFLISFFLISSIPKGNVVDYGDNVTVFFRVYTDNGLFEERILTLIIGSRSYLKEFQENIVGMHEGSRKRFVINSSVFGKWKKELVKTFRRVKFFNKIANITTDDFFSIFHKKPEIGEVYKNNILIWDIKVLNVKNKTVIVEQIAKNNSVINKSYGYSRVFVSNNTIKVIFFPKIGSILKFGLMEGRIVDYNSTHFFVDFNHPLAGKKATFDVVVLHVDKKNKIADVDFVISSTCNVSHQFILLLEELNRSFNGRIHMRPHHIIYRGVNDTCINNFCSPYGITDLIQSMRSICVFKLYPYLWFNYYKNMLSCVGDKWYCFLIVSKALNISIESIDVCMNTTYIFEKEFIFINTNDINEVPLLFVNGVKYNGVLSVRNIAEFICFGCGKNVKKNIIVKNRC